MQDIISLNRQLLIMARELANNSSGEIVFGFSKPVLKKISELSLDQIDGWPRSRNQSFHAAPGRNGDQSLSSLPKTRKTPYALAVHAAGG
jgi:hypothetical protein